MKLSKIQRVKKLCNYLIYKGYAGNEGELARLLGYTKSGFSQIINEKVPLTDKFIQKLVAVDKNINKVYIDIGVGDLINESENLTELKYTIEIQKKHIEILEEENNRLKEEFRPEGYSHRTADEKHNS